MKEMYLVIKTGYEGIESLCYLTDNKDDAIQQKRQFIEEEFKKRKELEEEWEKKYPVSKKITKQEIADFFCIQKWDGSKFKCICKELGVPPSKLMLR